MEYSLIIPTLNHLEDGLRPLCESIIRYTTLNDNIEIVVVANGCTDGTREYVNSLPSQFKLIWYDNPLGFTKATNEGVKQSCGKFVVLLNNDTELLSQDKDVWLRTLRSPFDKDFNVGIAGCTKERCWDIDREFIIFFCAMIRREIFDQIGLLDESFNPGFGEDIDFCCKIQDGGWKMALVPEGEECKLQNGMWTSSFPIYHKAESTVHSGNVIKENFGLYWSEIIARNINILKERYPVDYISKIKDKDQQLYDMIVVSNEYKIDKEEIKGRIVVDIGANIGFFIAVCLRYSPKHVYAAEPVPTTFSKLQQLFKNENRVSLFNNAVLDVPDKVVYLNSEDTGAHIIDAETPNKATSITLEQMIQGVNDENMILKMDCEGSEYTILLNAKIETIRRFEFIHIEIHEFGHELFADIANPFDNPIDSGLAAKWPKIDHLIHYIYDCGYDLVEALGYVGWNILPDGTQANHAEMPLRVCKFKRREESIKYSIIIPTFNKCDVLLKPCIESIKQYTDLSNVEVLIVANGCTDNTREYVESLGHPFKLLWHDAQLGYTKATNDGIRNSKGEYIVLLNNDIILTPQEKNSWLTQMEAPFSDDKVGITGPMKFKGVEGVSNDFMMFFCCMIPKKVINHIGYLDENFSPGGVEDVDFGLRLCMAGYEIRQIPNEFRTDDSVLSLSSYPIYHPGGSTVRDDPKWDDILFRNNEYLKKKFPNQFRGIDWIEKENKPIKFTIGYIDNDDSVFKIFLGPSLEALHCEEYDLISKSDKQIPAKNYNEIIKESKNKYIILLHQDVKFTPDFLDCIRETIKNRPDFGVLGCIGFGEFANLTRLTITSHPDHIIEVDFFDSLCVVINKENDIRFDEHAFDGLHLYVEDYCMQAKYKGLKNWSIKFDVENNLFHLGNTYRKTPSYGTWPAMWGDYNLYYEKFMGKWAKILNVPLFAWSKTEHGNWECIPCQSENIKRQEFLDNMEISIPSQYSEVYNEIFKYNAYRTNPDDFKNRTLIDIGGFRGFFTLLAIKHGARECHTFEPLLKHYQMTAENLKLFPEAYVYHKAVANRTTKHVTITNQDGASNIYNANLGYTRSGPDEDNVECTYLEEILKNCTPNSNGFLLKMDCEGAEYDIIEDSDASVLKVFDYIYVEAHNGMNPNPKYNYDIIIEMLDEKGFELEQGGLLYGTWYPDGMFVPNNLARIWKFKKKVSKIYDCFPFFNELELLEIRLEELYDTVDKFIITEADLTHSGHSKPFYLRDNLARFEKYKDKIIVHTVTLNPKNDNPPEDAWIRERYQRDAAMEVLQAIAKDHDYVVISDADEIPKASAIHKYIADNRDLVGVLQQERFTYYLNYRNIGTEEPQLNSKIVKFKTLKTQSLCAIRYCDRYENLPVYYNIDNGGWHFTFMGGAEKVKQKIQSFAHIEYDYPDKINSVEKAMKEGDDVYSAKSDWEFAEVNESYPKLIQRNKQEYIDSGWIKVKPKIYDCFMFFDELDVLEIRFNELYGVVDRFIIVEATQTHSGKDKPLYFQNNLKRFEKFLNKVSYFVLTEFPPQSDAWTAPWERENFQRNYIIQCLPDAQDHDMIIISDCDEIPKADKVKSYPHCMAFKQKLYYYDFNMMAKELWDKAKILPFKELKALQESRSDWALHLRNGEFETIEDGGWHFAWFSGVDAILRKLDAFSHQELNHMTKDDVLSLIKNNKDISGSVDLVEVEIDETYPGFVFYNQAFKIQENGAWLTKKLRFEEIDDKLCAGILELLNRNNIKKLYDFGCGTGSYVEAFTKEGIDATGFDGNPSVVEIKNCQLMDLTTVCNLPPVECVICLEVGEHIPRQYEGVFLSNIDRALKNNGILVLSWAIPGQCGFGHVNEQSNNYVKSILQSMNYENLALDENKLRENTSIPFFKDTVMVFRKNNVSQKQVTAYISSRDRYWTTLPSAILSIIFQTVKPKRLILFLDGEHVDLRTNDLYRSIFSMLLLCNIEWEVVFGEGKGQVLNHQKAIEMAKTEFLLRIDDDDFLQPNVLEELLSCMSPEVGAVGGVIIDPNNGAQSLPVGFDTSINNLSSNVQWFVHEKKDPVEVEHLYNSFLYRKEASVHGYCLELSPAGFREETLFTHEMFRNGWKLLVNPKALTWHARQSQGGIRAYQPHPEFWEHDEEVFQRKLKDWGVTLKKQKLIILDNGKGDHVIFKMILPEIKEKFKDRELIIGVCYEDVFEDEPGVKLISIQAAKDMCANLRMNYDDFNIYKFAADNNWRDSLVDAFRKLYLEVLQ